MATKKPREDGPPRTTVWQVECTAITPRLVHWFPTRREADQWAEFGHFCLAGHRITERQS